MKPRVVFPAKPRVVWKFPVPERSEFELSMPAGSEILHVAVKNQEPSLWALVDAGAASEKRSFRVVGTGEIFDAAGLSHVGTWVEQPGFVWHLFERVS
jgi:hypothetical protein